MRSWSELLAVIVCLAGLCLCGLNPLLRARGEARRRHCENNLRGLYQAAQAYQSEHAGAFQPVIVRTRPRWTYWYHFLQPYTQQKQHFFCPANPRAAQSLEIDPGDADLLPQVFDPSGQSYGMNSLLSSTGDPQESPRPGMISRLADPAYTIYLGDCKMPNPTLRPTRWCWLDDYAPLHQDGANFLLADGHCEWLNQETLGLLHAFADWKKDEKRWINWKK